MSEGETIRHSSDLIEVTADPVSVSESKLNDPASDKVDVEAMVRAVLQEVAMGSPDCIARSRTRRTVRPPKRLVMTLDDKEEHYEEEPVKTVREYERELRRALLDSDNEAEPSLEGENGAENKQRSEEDESDDYMTDDESEEPATHGGDVDDDDYDPTVDDADDVNAEEDEGAEGDADDSEDDGMAEFEDEICDSDVEVMQGVTNYDAAADAALAESVIDFDHLTDNDEEGESASEASDTDEEKKASKPHKASKKAHLAFAVEPIVRPNAKRGLATADDEEGHSSPKRARTEQDCNSPEQHDSAHAWASSPAQLAQLLPVVSTLTVPLAQDDSSQPMPVCPALKRPIGLAEPIVDSCPPISL